MDAPFPEGLVEEIHRVLDSTSFLYPGSDVYPDVFRSPLMFPLQRQTELAWMMQLARTVKPKTVMEIGSDKGGGLFHWCKSLETVSAVIAVEIRGTPYAREFEAAFSRRINFKWVNASSYSKSTIDDVKGFLARGPVKPGRLIDVLFIDGDKSHFDVDFHSYQSLMNPAGLVFMHDITDEAPGIAYKKVIAQTGYRHQEMVETSDTRLALDREKAGIPVANPHEGWLRHWKGKSCGVGCIFMPEYKPSQS